MKRISLVLLVLALGIGWAMEARADAAMQQKVVLQNGTVLLGTVVRMDASIVDIQTAQGLKRVPRASVVSISFVPKQAPPASPPEPQPPEPRPPEPTLPTANHRDARFYSPGSPPEYREVNSRHGFLISGLVLLPVGYGLALLSSSIALAVNINDSRQSTAAFMLMVPLAGPFITLGLSVDMSGLRAWIPWWMLLGITQALGTTFIIIGAMGEKKRVRIAQEETLLLPSVALSGGGMPGSGLSLLPGF